MAMANPYLSNSSSGGDFFLFSGLIYPLSLVFVLSGLAGFFVDKDPSTSFKYLGIGATGIAVVYFFAEWVEIVGWLTILVFVIWLFIASRKK